MERDERFNASGCKDPTPREAVRAMRREEWGELCRCVREMIEVANKHNMRVDGLIPLTGKRTGVRNWRPEDVGGCE